MGAYLNRTTYGTADVVRCDDCCVMLNSGHHYNRDRDDQPDPHAIAVRDRHNREHH